LIKPLAHTGLALALTISAYVNSGMLYYSLRKQGIYKPLSGWFLYLGKVMISSAGMATVLYLGVGDLQLWSDADLLERVSRLTMLILAGAASYFALIFILRVPLKEMIRGSA
jgi:putative peptidoglycan lipid II flippase